MTKEIAYLQHLWMRLTQFVELKTISAAIIAALSFIFDPNQVMALLALFILILLDFVFGVAASKKTGMQITSGKFYRTPLKLIVYFALIAAARLTEHALPVQMGFLDETLVGFLAATEMLSILEKSGYMGYAVPMKLLNQLQKYTQDK